MDQVTPNTTLPATGFVRQSTLIGKPTQPGPLPFSHATLWRKVQQGEFPKPVKLGPGVTAWRVEDVREWMRTRTGVAA